MKIQVSKLNNGLRIATRTMPYTKTVTVGIWINVGARDEKLHEHGIAHMLEHMVFKGTNRRDARTIAAEVENVGGFINAYTTREETAYYLRLLPEHLELGIDILFDILLNSTLPETEIEHERSVVIQEIGQSLDTPDDQVFDLFSEACYNNHALGRPILGTVDSVLRFKRSNLKGFLDRLYGASKMVFVASGAVEHDDVVKRTEACLCGLSDVSSNCRVIPKWKAGRKIVERKLEQSHIVFGLPSRSAAASDRFVLATLSNLYGGSMSSRLFQQLREKRGLCYSILSFPSLYSDSGCLSVYAGTSADQANEMLRLAANELASLAQSVSAEEVERAKAQLRAGLLMSRESVFDCAEVLAQQIILFGAPQDDAQLLDLIDEVDTNGVSNMAAQLISGGTPAIACVGPSTPLMDNNDLALQFNA